MKLKVRVVHYRCQGRDCWYADGCRTQAEAISAACAQLAALDQAIAAGTLPRRISENPARGGTAAA